MDYLDSSTDELLHQTLRERKLLAWYPAFSRNISMTSPLTKPNTDSQFTSTKRHNSNLNTGSAAQLTETMQGASDCELQSANLECTLKWPPDRFKEKRKRFLATEFQPPFCHVNKDGGFMHNLTLMLPVLIYLISCSPADGSVSHPRLVLANRRDIILMETTVPAPSSTVLLSGLNDAAALDFLYAVDELDRDESTFCWSDVNFERIHCANMTHLDNPKPLITSGLISPHGLGIDWVTKKLYWIDAETKRIEVCELHGCRFRKVLYWDSLYQPRALALYPAKGFMYWTDWGEVPKIERGGMNGDPNTRMDIITEQITWPNGITIDYIEERIYWVDASLSYIHSADLEGSNRRDIKSGELPHPFAITVFDDNLYWTDWKNRSIFTCPKNNCVEVSMVRGNLYSPMDVGAFEQSRQPAVPDGLNPCAKDNGGCSHLCLLAPEGSNPCACPTGILLKPDRKTCFNHPSEMLFLARRFDLRIISLDTPDFTDIVVEVENAKYVIAIDYDPVDEHVYWTDDEVRLIQRAYINGTGQETVVNAEVMNPDGIAVDWISRNLFWTDTGTDRIEVSRLNGSSRRVIISTGLDEPRAITLDPVNGYMYWTDWGHPAKIERAAYDGTLRETLIEDLITWPNGITIDFEFEKMYWADAKLDKIEMANLDGTARTLLVDHQIPHIFGFSLVGPYVYWTDWQRRTIERVDKQTGENRQVIIEKLPDLMSLRAIEMTPNPNYTNSCAGNNGNCSHLCLMTPFGHVCSCPMDMELQLDNMTCLTPLAYLIFSQRQEIKRVSIQNSHRDTRIPINNLENITSLDYHFKNERIYFADLTNHSIRHACLNGSAVSILLDFNRESPMGLTMDWISSNIYFIDKTDNRIEVYNPETRARRVVMWLKIVDPRDLAVHPTKSYIFWSDWVSSTVASWIGRANLDGTDQKHILPHSGRAASLTIDFHKDSSLDRLYWIDYNDHSIKSSDLEGRDFQVFKSDLRNPYALTIFNNSVYWYDLWEKVIKRTNQSNVADTIVIQSDISSMINLLAFHKDRQPGWSECATKNGGCQHLCFTLPDAKHKCACPTHYSLNADNRNCTMPKDFLLLSEKIDGSSKDMQIKRLIIDRDNPSTILPLRSMKGVHSIVYDLFTETVIWIQDGKSCNIRQASAYSSQSTTYLPPGEFAPASLAIEPFSRLLFWSDSDRNVINVTRISGQFEPPADSSSRNITSSMGSTRVYQSQVGVVLSSAAGRKPRFIAVNPQTGHLFFSDHKDPDSVQIVRSTLAGTNTKVIATNLRSLSSLVVDQSGGGYLYWADPVSQTIQSCSPDGTSIRVVLRNLNVSSITIFRDQLYYVDNSKLLWHVNKINGKLPGLQVMSATGQTELNFEITDIYSVDNNLYQHINPCAINNGGCSHICYINEGEKTCGCPSGLVFISNQNDCEPIPTCKPNEFTCVSGAIGCIPYAWRCDGQKECEDGSDEEGCPFQCDTSEFQCTDGQCIELSKYCDKIADCYDESDEPSGKCCSSHQFMCRKDFRCISASLLRNGNADCSDGSDERNYAMEPRSGGATARDPYAVGIIVVLCIVSVFIVVIIAFIVWKCHRRSVGHRFAINSNLMIAGLQQQNLMGLSHDSMPPVTAETVISGVTSVSATPYDRNHVTGASSSSSSITQTRGAGFNPPPSPVTERSAYMEKPSSTIRDDESSLASSYAPYRPTNRPNPSRLPHGAPPSTPISTCDDSDSLADYKAHRTRRKANKRYQLLPSPHLLPPSEQAPPPSPSTVRSYNSASHHDCDHDPYPPPPSPEPEEQGLLSPS